MSRAAEAVRLDGKVASAAVVERLRAELATLPFVPRLQFVRVGEDPASASYVRSKERIAERVGVESSTVVLPEGVGTADVRALVERFNADEQVDGILVQLPLPGVDASEVLAAIDPAKDVDGLHPVNVGLLWGGGPAWRPPPRSASWPCLTITPYRWRASAPSWWAAPTWWASRWPRCSCSATPP